MNSLIDDYIDSHATAEDAYLHALWRTAHIHLLNPRMSSGHIQGRLLKMLVQMAHPHHILEIGTYVGYSALCMAEGLDPADPEALVTTYEIDDELEPFTRKWIEGSPHGHRVKLVIGDALALVPESKEMFDFVFIDGDKAQYTDYYELALAHTRPGAIILADNTLWDGHVVDPAYAHDKRTQAICHFNNLVATDSRVECVMLPLRDGLTLWRRR